MDDKIVELLGAVVAQNYEIIAQNREFLLFLKERDANIPERTLLEIERAKIDNACLAKSVAVNSESDLLCQNLFDQLGITKADLARVKVGHSLGIYEYSDPVIKKVRAGLKALPEETE